MGIGNKLLLAGAGGLALALRKRNKQRTKLDLASRVVVITGGSRGLGLALAEAFAEQGARLALLARDGAELQRAQRELAANGAEVMIEQCDVRDEAQIQRAIAAVLAVYGRIDVLVNNAGIIQVSPLDHLRRSDFEDALATHTWGPLWAMQAVIPQMRRQGGGRIVNIASVGGKVAVPHLLPYSTSKFALVGLSDGMRAELAPDNILVTTVCPGLMRTGSHFNALFRGQHQREFAWFALLDALPVSSISVRRAAHQIVSACEHGEPQLIISAQAQAAVLLNTLAPRLLANVMKIMAHVLPGPTGSDGDQLRQGWESQSAIAPSVLTTLADQASERYNELGGHHPQPR